MDLFRDCLDQPVFDRKHRRMGRVDGIIIELEPTRPPRVAAIEIGMITLADRVSSWLSEKILFAMKRLRNRSDRYQIPWSRIRVGLNEVTADVEAEDTPALALELWLRQKVIGRIPGA
jgi:hypothetical protein